jgi:hypothetical protein
LSILKKSALAAASIVGAASLAAILATPALAVSTQEQAPLSVQTFEQTTTIS